MTAEIHYPMPGSWPTLRAVDIRPSHAANGNHFRAAGAEQAGPDHKGRGNQSTDVGSVDIHPGHGSTDLHGGGAGVEQAGTSHAPAVTQLVRAGSVVTPVPQGHADPQIIRGDGGPPDTDSGVVGDFGSSYEGALLALLAETVDDLEKARIASENRLRHMTRSVEDSDGETRGLGLDEEVPAVRAMLSVTDGLRGMEHQSVLSLKRALRTHPLGPWVKHTVGVGEKQGARLLAAIGDPYWNTLHNRPRTVSELWAYCGLHVLPLGHHVTGNQARGAEGSKQGGGPGSIEAASSDQTVLAAGVAPRRQKGQRVNWSTTAKTRVFLIAESCIKQRTSPYRAVYDTGRLKYADSLHQQDCHRCGPSGKPAPAGTPLSLGHQHARAMRLVMKAVLKDLWRESARLHGATTDPQEGTT